MISVFPFSVSVSSDPSLLRDTELSRLQPDLMDLKLFPKSTSTVSKLVFGWRL